MAQLKLLAGWFHGWIF